MPIDDINSTSELISIALAGEREAIRRYTKLAHLMREHGNDDAGALFEGMIDEERAQQKQLTELAELSDLEILPDCEPVRWDDPGVVTTYDAQAGDPHQSTPYKALAFAAHNKERAFRFYAYVAANCTDPEVCRYAEMLAREKLNHTATLRARRRRAWHAQRRQFGADPRIDTTLIRDRSDLLAATVCIERIVADVLDEAVGDYPDLTTIAADARRQTNASAEALDEAGPPDRKVTAALLSIESWHKNRFSAQGKSPPLLERLCRDCERSFAFYDSVVTSAQDESVMLEAQRLSSHALKRIGVLRNLTGGCCEHIVHQAPL